MATRIHAPRALWAFFFAFALGGAGWLAAGYGGTPSQARVPGGGTNLATMDQATAPTPVYECYSISGGQDPKKAVLLTTKNFGHDVVGVRTANLMCESAFKLTQLPPAGTPQPQPPDPATSSVFECFKTEKGNAPNDPAVLQTANFGADKVIITRATQMCENALKRDPNGNILGDRTTVPGLIQIWQCYQLQNAISPNKLMYFVNNNFGLHRANVRNGDMMCETATKQTNAAGEVFGSQVEPYVLQCFRLADAQPVNQPRDLLTRNFPEITSAADNDPWDAVRVQRPAYMCEPAKKQHIIEYPFDPAGNPTGADVDSNGD